MGGPLANILGEGGLRMSGLRLRMSSSATTDFCICDYGCLHLRLRMSASATTDVCICDYGCLHLRLSRRSVSNAERKSRDYGDAHRGLCRGGAGTVKAALGSTQRWSEDYGGAQWGTTERGSFSFVGLEAEKTFEVPLPQIIRVLVLSTVLAEPRVIWGRGLGGGVILVVPHQLSKPMAPRSSPSGMALAPTTALGSSRVRSSCSRA